MKSNSPILLLTLTQSVKGRWDQYLSQHLPSKSRSYIQKLIKEGYVWIDGQASFETRLPPKVGSQIEIFEKCMPSCVEPQKMNLTILYEDEDVIVFNKPVGLVVHAGAGSHSETLVNGLMHHCAGKLSTINGIERMGIVHRLDKDTSGVMVAAKSDRAYRSLRKQFDDHSITRIYHGLIWGLPVKMTGKIDKPIGRHLTQRQKMAVRATGRPAQTDYKVTDVFLNGKICKAEFTLHTGRTHQIRVHMASLGHPLIGDKTYGKETRFLETLPMSPLKTALNGLNHQALHAYTLGFIHPVSQKNMIFSHPWPQDLEELETLLKS